MHSNQCACTIPVPRSWPKRVKSAVLHLISLAQFILAHARGWTANCVNPRVRQQGELDRATQEIALLREEIRIKDARMTQLPPHRRPYYPPTERMAILQLRAARCWSLEQTARVFLLTGATIASWLKRIDEKGADALVKVGEPVNRFPDFVRYGVQQLKLFCPMLGKIKIAQILARAGLHLGVTTIGRMLKEEQANPRTPAQQVKVKKSRVPTSKYPNHVWEVDLTTVPVGTGLWTAWLPFSLPACWPFCWWVAVVMDHDSRRIMGIVLFSRQPTSEAVRAFISRARYRVRATPRHLISDKGPQFWCDGFKKWCRKKGIKPRFGAVGRHGSIAVTERLILTLKQGIVRLLLVPLRRERFRLELDRLAAWYNEHRPHMSLGGRTPDEVYHCQRPANCLPRFEPRPGWPRCSACAKPVTLVKGKPGVRLKLEIACVADHRNLPIVTLKRAA